MALLTLRSVWPRTRLVWAIAVAAAAIVGAAGCGNDDDAPSESDPTRSPDTPIVIPAGRPIVVGVSTALTGPVGERGTEYRDAVIVSVNRWKTANGGQIGGHEIEVRAEDDGCAEADQAGIAARRLVGVAGLVGVVGPQCSGGAIAAMPVYGHAGVVSISGSATRTDLTTDQAAEDFFFRTAYRNDLEGTFVALFIVETVRAESVYLIDDDEPFGKDLATEAQRLLEDAGVSVVRRSVSQGTVDFALLAAEVASLSPDFVAFAGFNPEAALIYRQIRDAGYPGLFGAGDGAASVTGFVEPVGADAAEGVLFSGCQYPLAHDFIEDFIDAHGGQPSATFTAQYADATTVLLDAVKAVAKDRDDGSLEIDPGDLRDAVRATSIKDGVSGALAFDTHGDRVPEPGDDLSELQGRAFTMREDIFTALGLIPCQVQNGALVPSEGPGSGEIELP